MVVLVRKLVRKASAVVGVAVCVTRGVLVDVGNSLVEDKVVSGVKLGVMLYASLVGVFELTNTGDSFTGDSLMSGAASIIVLLDTECSGTRGAAGCVQPANSKKPMHLRAGHRSECNHTGTVI